MGHVGHCSSTGHVNAGLAAFVRLATSHAPEASSTTTDGALVRPSPTTSRRILPEDKFGKTSGSVRVATKCFGVACSIDRNDTPRACQREAFRMRLHLIPSTPRTIGSPRSPSAPICHRPSRDVRNYRQSPDLARPRECAARCQEVAALRLGLI